MGFFKHIEGEAAVLVDKGVYRQVDLYERDGVLYAKVGAGFVKLYATGATTKPSTRVETLSFDGALYKDGLDRLLTRELPGAKSLTSEVKRKLLGSG